MDIHKNRVHTMSMLGDSYYYLLAYSPTINNVFYAGQET